MIGIIATMIEILAVAIKRLHDRGKSAWWLLLFYLVPGLLSWTGLAPHPLELPHGTGQSIGPVLILGVVADWAISTSRDLRPESIWPRPARRHRRLIARGEC